MFCLIVLGAVSVKIRADIPAAFADIGYGARPLGMGGAYVAMAGDPYAVFFNPACLPDAAGWQIGTLYAKQFGLIPYTLASVSKGWGGRHGAAIAVMTSGDDVLRESTVLAAWGFRPGKRGGVFSRLSLGLTLKARISSFGNEPAGGDQRIQGSATGQGLDIGIHYHVSNKWALGLLLRDAWNRVNYDNRTRGKRYSESVPAALIVGTSYSPAANLIFALDFDKALYKDVRDRFLAGLEWRLMKIVFFRTGLSQSLEGDPNRKLNWGLGLQHIRKRFGVRFDFAYQVNFLANTPRVSTTVWF
jgi:hypothetical protein